MRLFKRAACCERYLNFSLMSAAELGRFAAAMAEAVSTSSERARFDTGPNAASVAHPHVDAIACRSGLRSALSAAPRQKKWRTATCARNGRA